MDNVSNLQDKFVDEMQRIITSRKKVSIKKDQGWYSEAEMKADLKWGQHLGLNSKKNWHTNNGPSAVGFSFEVTA